MNVRSVKKTRKIWIYFAGIGPEQLVMDSGLYSKKSTGEYQDTCLICSKL